MAKKVAEPNQKSKDKINYNESAKNGKPYWFQVMVNGKRVTKRGYRTFTEAKRAREELSTQLVKGSYVDPTRVLFVDYFLEWLDGRENIEDSTRELYMSYYKNHIQPFFNSKEYTLPKLGPMDIKKFVAHLRKKGLGDEAVKRIYATLDASLNAAEMMEIIQKNPTSKIPKEDKPKVIKKEREIWSNDSIKYVLSNGKGTTRYWIAIFLAIMTGMRQGEILGLKWSDIDWDRSVLYVRRSLRKDKVIFKPTKNISSTRTISLSPITIAFLKEQLEIITAEKLLLRADYEDNNLIVCSSKGTPARASKVLDAWYRMCNKFKPIHEPRVTYHDLRHQSASIMLNEREDIRVVSKRLGHSNVGTTLNTYSHLLPTAQESAALALDRSVGITTDLLQ